MKIISICNQKGGVGKTSTANILAAGLTYKGYRVLAIDFDPQTNLSLALGINTADVENDIYGLLQGEAKIEESVIRVKQGFDIIPGTTDLSAIDSNCKNELKDILEPIKKKYDYCVIDTPPALGYLSVQALKSTDIIIVPAEADIFSLQGLLQLNETILAVKSQFNKKLKVEGVLLTRYDSRQNMSKDVKEALNDITKKLHTKLFSVPIRTGAAVKKVMCYQENLFTDYKRENVTQDYLVFINELIGENK